MTTPTAELWFGELVESVTRKYDFRFPVERSRMLDEPDADAVAS